MGWPLRGRRSAWPIASADRGGGSGAPQAGAVRAAHPAAEAAPLGSGRHMQKDHAEGQAGGNQIGSREFADPRQVRKEVSGMVTITFPDRETEKRAVGFLLGRFSGRVLRSGEHLVPEAALEALADSSIPFTVKGKATYEQQLAAVRGAAPAPLQ